MLRTCGQKMPDYACAGLYVVNAHDVIPASFRERHYVAVEENDRDLLSLEQVQYADPERGS